MMKQVLIVGLFALGGLGLAGTVAALPCTFGFNPVPGAPGYTYYNVCLANSTSYSNTPASAYVYNYGTVPSTGVYTSDGVSQYRSGTYKSTSGYTGDGVFSPAGSVGDYGSASTTTSSTSAGLGSYVYTVAGYASAGASTTEATSYGYRYVSAGAGAGPVYAGLYAYAFRSGASCYGYGYVYGTGIGFQPLPASLCSVPNTGPLPYIVPDLPAYPV
jgi:hypothetical protein